MQQPSSQTIWFNFGVLFAFVALVLIALGAYSIMHTHNNVRIHEDIIGRRKNEIMQLQAAAHLPENRVRIGELTQMVEVDLNRLTVYKGYRDTAFLIGGSSVLATTLAITFLSVFAVNRFRKS